MRQPREAHLAVQRDAQGVVAEDVHLDTRDGLTHPVGPRAVEQDVVVVARHERHAGAPLEIDLRARPPCQEECGEDHAQRELRRGHRRSYGTTTVSPGPSVTLLLPVTRSW